MRKHLLLLCFLVPILAFGQTKKQLKKALKQVNSVDQIDDFISTYDKISSIRSLDIYTADTTFEKSLSNLKANKVLTVRGQSETIYYKVVRDKPALEYRLSYVFFDGKRLGSTEIDSLRDLVIERYRQGTPFASLNEEYNMDTNDKKGDFGWFKSGDTVPEFEAGIKDRKKGEIFKVDVEDRDWYYVVLKTHDNRINTWRIVLEVKIEE